MCVCVCVCVCEEIADFGKSEKMIKISEKVDKPIFRSILETELYLNENEFFLSLAIEEINKTMIKI